jgi:hypothetical protein
MKNKILIYDDNCPLCTWYSGMFVKFGLLPAEGRKAFSSLEPSLLNKIDFQKGKNEIPLPDPVSGKVWYGVDSLLEILGRKLPLIKQTGNLKPVKWCLKKLYKLVSYNRKVIVAKKCGPGSIDCAPDINYFYRLLFMVVCLVFNTLMLFPVHEKVFAKLLYYSLSVTELQAAHFGLVFINCLLTLNFKKEKAIEYLGQVNMLALITILLLLPLLAVVLILQSDWLISVYLTAAAGVVFKEYLRRMEYAGVLINNKWVVSMNLLSLSCFILYLFG